VLLDDDELYEVDKYAPQAKVVYFETPVNPRSDCLSIRRVVAGAKRIGALVIKDNTFASPINQTPLDLGVDIVIHSATKYIGGHADVTAGAVLGSRALIEPVFAARKVFGGIPSPHDAFLLDRSLKTLELRVQQHNTSALALAQFLEQQSNVKQVMYPGLPSSASHAIACEQMRGFGGMLCIELDNLAQAKQLCENLKIGLNVAHLGTAETLVSIPVLTSHSMLNDEELRQVKLSPGMVRISVGLENTEDLIADFEQALAAI
jgi:cystathionine beta-lyase/cystathionine gamma-synthase